MPWRLMKEGLRYARGAPRAGGCVARIPDGGKVLTELGQKLTSLGPHILHVEADEQDSSGTSTLPSGLKHRRLRPAGLTP